jgi:hypothetical protein
MDVYLIQVPYMMGDERQGKGPLRLVQAGAEKLVASKGVLWLWSGLTVASRFATAGMPR